MKIGFDNDKYLAMQSAHIRERIAQFDNNVKEMVLCRGKMMLELRALEKLRRIAEMSLKTF